MLEKPKAIYQDQRIAEEFCNFKCEYCGGFYPDDYSISKDELGNLKLPKEWYKKINKYPNVIKNYFKEERTLEQFYYLSKDIMNKTSLLIDSDILKISGGELTLYSQLCDFVDSIHNKYISIQILSNGFNLDNNDILRYKKMGNISFQISIDGVTPKSNYSKTHSEFITKKVLENIKLLLKNNIGVEINCVLTKYNTNTFIDFLEYFKDAKNFIVVPRPVRGEPRKIIDFSKQQVREFEKHVMDNYEKYKQILPPKKYLERLINIMKTKKRKFNCYIPFFVQSIDGYGNFEMCPLGLKYENNKNILDNSINNKEILINCNYNINNKYDLCNYCIVQFEMLNLYVDQEISEEELKKLPSLNNDIIISHIKEIKDKIIEKNNKNLISIIQRKYHIKGIKRLERREDSTDGNVYIIHTVDNKYVMKIYDDFKHVKSMTELYTKLYKNHFYVPKVILSNNKGYVKVINGKYIVLYSFLKGTSLGKNLTDDIIKELAIQLRKFHDITNDNNIFNLKKLPFAKNINMERCSALHFDLTKNNIFYEKNKDTKIGFIDFDDAKYGASVCDVAITIANLFFSKTRGVDLKSAKLFIDCYYNTSYKLKKYETQYIKKFALNWIKYVMDGNEFDTSTKESFEVRYRLIKENL